MPPAHAPVGVLHGRKSRLRGGPRLGPRAPAWCMPSGTFRAVPLAGRRSGVGDLRLQGQRRRIRIPIRMEKEHEDKHSDCNIKI